MDEIQELLGAWLPEDVKEQLQSSEANRDLPPWILDMSVAALASQSNQLPLASALLTSPETAQLALLRFLAANEALPRGSRVWIRPALPWPEPLHFPEALRLARAAPGSLRSFTGIVTAMSPVEDALMEMTYCCEQCDSKERVFLDSPAPLCCAETMAADLSTLITVPAQTLLLSPATSTSTPLGSDSWSASIHTPAAVCLRDDLVGLCNVGDHVTCTGASSCLVMDAKSSAQGKHAFAQQHMHAMALHIFNHHPCLLECSNEDEKPIHPAASLGTLLERFKSLFSPSCSQLTQLALLLSACSSTATAPEVNADTDEALYTDPDSDVHQINQSRSHPRLNVLLLTQGEGLSLQQMVRSAAHSSCSHVTDGSLNGTSLLPSALAIPNSIPLVAAGQLAAANSGVCVLSSSGLSSKQGRAVGETLRTGKASVQISPTQSLSIDVHPTVWCVADVFKPQASKRGRWAGAQEQPPPAAVFAEKFSPQLVSQFDILLDCAPTVQETESWADEYLNSLINGGTSSVAPASAGGEKENSPPVIDLQRHIAKAQSLAAPVITPAAMQLLSGYWAALREAQGQGGTAAVLSLKSAVTIAAASARLFHRSEILPFPDVTIAVVYCEEALIARGWVSALWGPLRESLTTQSASLDDCLGALQQQLQCWQKMEGGSVPWEDHEE